MTYNLFGGTLSLTQSINHFDMTGCRTVSPFNGKQILCPLRPLGSFISAFTLHYWLLCMPAGSWGRQPGGRTLVRCYSVRTSKWWWGKQHGSHCQLNTTHITGRPRGQRRWLRQRWQSGRLCVRYVASAAQMTWVCYETSPALFK